MTNKTNNSSKLKNLNPFIDCDSLLRVGGRHDLSEKEYENKKQLLLPKNSRFTYLYILNMHHLAHCASVNYIFNELRKRYWILAPRRTIKKILRKCMVCRI